MNSAKFLTNLHLVRPWIETFADRSWVGGDSNQFVLKEKQYGNADPG